MLAAMIAGCANSAPRSASSGEGGTGHVVSAPQGESVDPEAGFDEVVPDWDNPIDGVDVASPALAATKVSFELRVPDGLTDPTSIFVSSEEVPKDASVVAFVYDAEPIGRVIVIERIPESPPDEYQKFHEYLVSLNGDPLLHGRFDLVPVRSGALALVTTSEDGSRSVAFWLEDGVEYIVEGPTLSFDQAIQVAELI
jgi:hypothetical protein